MDHLQYLIAGVILILMACLVNLVVEASNVHRDLSVTLLAVTGVVFVVVGAVKALVK